MSADRRPSRSNLNQEFAFANAIEELSQWKPGHVDVENALHSLSGIRNLRPNQAKVVLDLARESIDHWMGVKVDPKQVVDALVPSFRIYRQHVSQQNNPDLERDYSESVSVILSGIIEDDPENYSKAVSFHLKKGAFGPPAIILTHLFQKPFETIKDGGIIWDEFEGYETLEVVLDDLIEMGDQDAIESLKPYLPVAFMLHYIACYRLSVNPRVEELLESAAEDYPPNIAKLAQNYLNLDECKKEEISEMILEGQFGSPTLAARMLISALLEKEEQAKPEVKEEIKETVENLWVDLLDKDRSDIGLQPIREMIIARPWYWEGEDVAYTAVESINGLGLKVEEFVERYGDLMLDAIENHLFPKEKLDLKIPGRTSREAIKQRLVNILKDLGQDDLSSETALFRNLPDRLLADSLHPLRKSPRAARNPKPKAKLPH